MSTMEIKNVECTTHNTQELALLTMVPVQY